MCAAKFVSVAVLALATIGVAGVAYGDIVAMTPTTISVVKNGPFAAGWAFTVNEAIAVTSLGAFDIAGDGHPTGQQVRLYDETTDSVLATATISDTASPETVGGLSVYYQTIAPLMLTPGHTFIVASSDNTTSDFANTTADTWDAAINVLSSRATLFSAPVPDHVASFAIQGSSAQDLYLGAEFKFNVVPEPGALTLLAGGLASLLCYAWRKRR